MIAYALLPEPEFVLLELVLELALELELELVLELLVLLKRSETGLIVSRTICAS